MVSNELNHRISTGKGDSDDTASKKTACKTILIFSNHELEYREYDTGIELKDSNSSNSGDEDGNAVTKFIKALHHAGRSEPKTNSDETSNDNNGDHVEENISNAKFVLSGVHNETAGDASERDGYHTNKSTCTKVRTIFRIDDTKSYRNGENDGRSHHGAENKTSVVTNGLVSSHLHSKRITAHVASKKGGCKHGSISAYKFVNRSDNGVKNKCKDRSNSNNACHGHSKRAHCVDTFFKLLAIAVLIAADTVDSTDDHEDGHNHNNDSAYCSPTAKVCNPIFKRLNAHRQSFVPNLNKFIKHKIDLLK